MSGLTILPTQSRYSRHLVAKAGSKKVNCFSPTVQRQIFKTNQMSNQILGV
jgi:hypothetical protein